MTNDPWRAMMSPIHFSENQPAPTDIAVVIVTYNSGSSINNLLDSLPDALGKIKVTVVVVDNGSTDNTRQLVRARDDCILIESVNVGYAAGINIGVRATEPSKAMLILNPDILLYPGSVGHLLRALEAKGGVGISVPRVLNQDETLARSLRRAPTIPRALGFNWTGLAFFSEYISDPAVYERKTEVDWALGAVMAVTRECYDKLNGWDESYFLYSEETDFCLRANEAGFGVTYEPSAVAVHIGGGSGQSARTHSMLIVNRIRLYARRHSRVAAAIYLWCCVVTELSWAIRGEKQSLTALLAVLYPPARPVELKAGRRLIPR